jgi:hypothetical protein
LTADCPSRVKLVVDGSRGANPEKGGELCMSVFDDAMVISVYTLDQAVEDGVLVEIVKDRWPELSGGKRNSLRSYCYKEVA